jgi:hypothetical protein
MFSEAKRGQLTPILVVARFYASSKPVLQAQNVRFDMFTEDFTY